ncbi:cysteine hydrolase family protein [Acinetobacter rathckeae]|uniref:cysteine hydrolase family protein n=1 Tax=Acinetobacter rathckeae TaxID=2605272 RepID=UPI0018A313AA|nr:isochorismatase family cysteine hydrolase [Acinetobacter rathckeae]MBF7688324.1 cysteine hydrolase [Acinetobacter rathckeae]MBF7695157.1 cysteine hydrolase [Acinetobacter rathckeae]
MTKKVTWDINPQRTALIIVDMQKVFCEKGQALYVPDTAQIIGHIQSLTALMRSKNMPVIYLRHVVRGDGSDTGRMKDLYPNVDEILARTDPAVEIIDELSPQVGDIIVDKLFYSGFHNTDLDAILRMKDIDTLIVCGTVTNVCCETTIRDGVHREYKMIAVSDANAAMAYPDMGFGAVSAAEVQRISLSAMAYEFAEVTTTENLIQRMA